jgi:site-specific recombinase XerD
MSELRRLKQRYLTYLETQWGGSAKMIENYDRYLERFLRFAKVQRPADITKERVASFRLHLSKQPGASVDGKAQPMKQSTQNYYLIALRMFVQFLLHEGFTTLTPQQIKLAKLPTQTIDTISSEELQLLLAAPDCRTLEGMRDRAIMELVCSTGLRISELCALSVADLLLHTNELTITSSQGKSRIVFLNQAARLALARYVQSREDEDDALFVRYGRKANVGGSRRIHPRAIQRMIKKYATQTGISSTVTPHVLRHTFASDLLRNGADIRSVQALLGHAKTDTTRFYINQLKSELH